MKIYDEVIAAIVTELHRNNAASPALLLTPGLADEVASRLADARRAESEKSRAATKAGTAYFEARTAESWERMMAAVREKNAAWRRVAQLSDVEDAIFTHHALLAREQTCENDDVNAAVLRQCVDTSIDDLYWDTNDLTTGGGGILLGCGNLNCGANRPKSRNGLGHTFDVSVQLRTDSTSGGFVTGPNIGWYCNGLRARGNWAPAITTHDGNEGGVFSDCVTIACRRAANLRSRGTVLQSCHFIADPDTSSGTHIGVTAARWANDLIVSGCQFEGFPVDFSIGTSAFNLGYSHILQGIQSRGCTDHSILMGSSLQGGSRQGIQIDGYTIRDFNGTSYIEVGNNVDYVRVRSLVAAGACSAAGIDVLDTALGADLGDITITDCGASVPPVRVAGASTVDLGLVSLVGDCGDFDFATTATVRLREMPQIEVTVADDAVFSFVPDNEFESGSCMLEIVSGTTATAAILYCRGNATPTIAWQPASVVEVATGALTGTTGTDGALTVSKVSATRFDIENRRGASVTLRYGVTVGAQIQ